MQGNDKVRTKLIRQEGVWRWAPIAICITEKLPLDFRVAQRRKNSLTNLRALIGRHRLLAGLEHAAGDHIHVRWNLIIVINNSDSILEDVKITTIPKPTCQTIPRSLGAVQQTEDSAEHLFVWV